MRTISGLVAACYEFGRISAYLLHYVGRMLLARRLNVYHDGDGLFAVDYRAFHVGAHVGVAAQDRKSTRLNSSHL